MAKKKMKVLALTAIRSEYDLLYPLLKAMRKDKAFSVGVIAAGAHLTSLHRRSVRQIEADGFRIAARIRNFTPGARANTTAGRVEGAARLLGALAKVLEREKPDLLLYLGDREEPLMAAVAAAYMGVPSVHLGGGDHTAPKGGDVDEEARHATSKLSRVHLTTAKAHAERLRRMGEEPWRIKTVGNPGLDRLRESSAAPRAGAPYVVVIHHAVSSARAEAPAELALCLAESLAAGVEVFVGAPNSDPGYADLQRIVKKYSNDPRVHLYRNLPREEFTSLLKGAKAVVGNSSLGLLEASFIGLPCVNVGERQRGRIAGLNVQFVDASRSAVRRALRKALFDGVYRARVRRARSPYGDGRTAARVIRFLKTLPPKARLLAKTNTY
jgi:GDP/UDP-N,N'-diacetylbacillosamine 2-epimerase (hydrolysing)